MATLRKRKDRDNHYELDYRDPGDRNRRYRIDTGTSDRKVASVWLSKVEQLQSQVRLGLIAKIGRIDASAIAGKKATQQEGETLESFMRKYEDRCRHDLELAENTIANNNLAFRSLMAVVGNQPLGDLTDERIITWKRTLLKQGRTKTTIGIYFRHLRAAYGRAVKWLMVSSNPFLLVEEGRDKLGKRKKDKDLSVQEVQTLLAAIDQAGDVDFANFVRFLLLTGARRNEILFLKWEDVDLDNMKLKCYSDKTKREIELPINKALLKVVQRMDTQHTGYVFQTKSRSRGAFRKEQPWHEDYVSHHFKKYIRDLGMPEHYSLHSLRHTYTNRLLKQGVPLDIVQKLLGHSSPRTTSENYDHTIALHFRTQADLADFESE